MTTRITRTSGADLNVSAIPVVQPRGELTQETKARIMPIESVPWNKTNMLHFRRYMYTWNGFEVPEYNYYDVSSAEDGDGIIRQSIQRKSSLMFKSGWTLLGNNSKTVDYIRNRFIQLSLTQNKPMDILLEEVGDDLIRYHNAFLLKVRTDKASSGDLRRGIVNTGRERNLKPVAGYFRLPVETMRVKVNNAGVPIKWLQLMPDGRRQEFDPKDIVHFYFNRRAGFTFSAPGYLPAIEDVRSLRRLEEYLEILVEQYLYPMIVMTIGNDASPIGVYPDGTTEVDEWQQRISELEPGAGLVVSNRMKIEPIGFTHNLAMTEYLEYFKKRVYVACGISPVDLGETSSANKSSADNASKQLIDHVKGYQQRFANLFNFEIIQELLLERFNESVLLPEHNVQFEFNEIDLDNKMKLENHHTLMYSMNGLTESEMREKNHWKPITEEGQKELYLHKYEIPKIEAGGRVKAETQGTKGASQSQSSNRAKPKNQHKASLSSEDNIKLLSIMSTVGVNSSDLVKKQLSLWLFQLENQDDLLNFSNINLTQLDGAVDSTFEQMELGATTEEAQVYLKSIIDALFSN